MKSLTIRIPKTCNLTDVEKFIERLKQLAYICHVSSISGVKVCFEDGTSGRYKGLWMATGLFRKND